MMRKRIAKGRSRNRVALPFRVVAGEHGIAMPIAVVSLAIIFLVCMLVVTIGIGEMRVSMMTNYSTRALKIAEAGVSRAMTQLRNEPELTSSETTGDDLNWPHQAASGPNPVPTLVHRNSSFAGGKYECWLFQDPDDPSDHTKKVLRSYGSIISEGVTYSRTLETKVTFTAENPNYFDAFNFLVYNGNELGARATFEVKNYFGSYTLDGLGSAGDGWGIYSVGDILLESHFLGLGSNIKGNVISEDDVTIGGTASGLWPISVNGTVYAGIDGSGNAEAFCYANFLQLSAMYIGKIYAANDVDVKCYGTFGPTLNGSMTIDRGIECGGKVEIGGIVSGSIWGGGLHIGHMDQGPTDGIKARGGVEADGIMTAIDIGDIWSGYYTDGANRVGINFDANTVGTIYAGNVESTGYLELTPITGGITMHDVWAGTSNGTGDGITLDTSGWTPVILGYLGMEDVAARGKVVITAIAGGFGTRNIYAGYQTDGGTERHSVQLRAVAGGFSSGVINGFGEVYSLAAVGGLSIGGINAGTNAISGNGGTGADVLIAVGGAGIGDIKTRGKTKVQVWFGGIGVGNITAGTDQAGLHGGTGIEFLARAGGAGMGSGTCVGKFVASAIAGGAVIDGNITAGTDSTTLLGGKGTGGDGISFSVPAGGISVNGNITSRGRVPLEPLFSFGITVGNFSNHTGGDITAGTNNTSGDGGTGLYVNANVNVAPIRIRGNIRSRGMVDSRSVLSYVTLGYDTGSGEISAVTAGTNSSSLAGGEGINISNTLDLSSIIDWPNTGHLRSAGRVKVTATAGGVHVNGEIWAGYCDDATLAHDGAVTARNGVWLDTSLLGGIQVGDYSAGIRYGITSVGSVLLNCNGIAGYFNSMDIAGLIKAGKDNVVNKEIGVDIRPSALGVNIGSASTGGIQSSGRTDLNTSWGQGINVRGWCKIGSDKDTGRDKGFSMLINSSLNILWGGITVSGLIEASGPVKVTSFFSDDFDESIVTSGIKAGLDGDNRNSGYGVILDGNAGSIDDNGTITTQGSVYIFQHNYGYIECNNITTGPAAGGTGLNVYYGDFNLGAWNTIIRMTGTVTTRGKVYLHYMAFPSIVVNEYVRMGTVNAGAEDLTTGTNGVEVHGITGGTIYFDQCHSYGQIYLDTGPLLCDFNYDLRNVWCATAINWSWDTWPDCDTYLRGYLRSPSDINICTGAGGSDDFHYDLTGGVWTGGTFTVKPGTDFNCSGGIQAVGGVSIDTWGDAVNVGNIKCGWMSFGMDDGSWNLSGSPALECQGDINLTPNMTINWAGALRSQGHININTDGDETVDFGRLYSKLSVGVNLDDGNWDLNGGVESQQGWSTSYNAYADCEIWNGGSGYSIWLGGTLDITCEEDYWLVFDLTEGGMRIYNGIAAQGNVVMRIPKDPDPGYQLSGGITAMGTVTINANYRAKKADENLVDSGGIWAGGTVTLNYASDDRDGEWAYVYGDVKSPGTVTSNARREAGSCDWCWGVCFGGCGNTDPSNWEYLNVSGTIYAALHSYTLRNNLSGDCSRQSSFLCYCNHCHWSQYNTYGGVVRGGSSGGTAGPSVTYPPNADFTVTTSAPGAPSLPSTPAATIDPPAVPSVHTDVNNLVPAATGGGDLPLPDEPAMPTFGGTQPYFPAMENASSDLPAWMAYTSDVITPSGGYPGRIPGLPPAPTWGAAQTYPDFNNLLPFGGATEVKMPKPQWVWWRQQAQSQGAGHYSAGDLTISLAPGSGVSSDEVYFAEGNVTINSMDFPDDSVVHEATILAAGTTGAGDITVSTSATWKIYNEHELHLIAKNDVSLSPASFTGSLSIGDQAVLQFWAGRNITVAMPFLSGILGTGVNRGNLIGGNQVSLTDPWNLGIGWYNFSYYRPTIKAEGWIVPFRSRDWHELTNRNWTDSTPSG